MMTVFWPHQSRGEGRPHRSPRHRRPRAALVAYMAWALSLLLVAGPASAQPDDGAGGIGIAPASVAIGGALRGATYGEHLILENGNDADVEFVLSPEGEVGTWVSFTEMGDHTRALSSVAVPAGRRADVRIQVTVPASTANGTYTGAVQVMSRRVGDGTGGGAGAGVGIGALLALSVEVTGDERRAGALVDSRVDPAEVGMPVSVHAVVRNDGNVGLRPVVRVVISRGDEVAERLDTEGELFPVDPGKQADVVVLWDTSEHRGGDYVASIAVVDTAGGNDLALGGADVAFRLEPRGTFTRSGTLQGLELVNRPEPGGVAQLEARFANTGQIETTAVFVGDVYRDGVLVRSVQSPPRLAPVGTTVDVGFAIDGVDAARWRVIGRVNYEGRETDVRSVEFRVGGDAGTTAGPSLAAAGAGAAAVAAAAGVGLLARRRRHRHRR